MRTAILVCVAFACSLAVSASTDFFSAVPSSGSGNPTTFEITVENANNQGGSGSAFLTIPATLTGCKQTTLSVDIIAGGSTLTTQTYTPSAGAAITLPASSDLLIVVSYDEAGVDESSSCTITITGQPHLIPCTQCGGAAPCCACGTSSGTCSQTSTLCDTTGFTGGDPATSKGCWCSGAKQCHFTDANCDTTVGFGQCDLPHPVYPTKDTPPAGATQATTPYTTKPSQDGNTVCFANSPTTDLLFGEKIQYNSAPLCCTGIGTIVVPTSGNNLTPFCRLKACPSEFTFNTQCTLLYKYYYSQATGNVNAALCYTNCYTSPANVNFFEAVIEPTPVTISGATLAPAGSFNLKHNAARLHSPVLTATNVGATAGFNVACDFIGKVSGASCVPYDCGFYGTCVNKADYYYTGETDTTDGKTWCWGACYVLP